MEDEREEPKLPDCKTEAGMMETGHLEADLGKEHDVNTKVPHGSLLCSFDRLPQTSDDIRGTRINHYRTDDHRASEGAASG